MIKPIARLVRPDRSDKNDGMVLMALLPGGNTLFKKGYVYQLDEVMGELVLQEVGPSHVPKKGPFISWCSDISEIQEHLKKMLFLSKKEVEDLEQDS